MAKAKTTLILLPCSLALWVRRIVSLPAGLPGIVEADAASFRSLLPSVSEKPKAHDGIKKFDLINEPCPDGHFAMCPMDMFICAVVSGRVEKWGTRSYSKLRIP